MKLLMIQRVRTFLIIAMEDEFTQTGLRLDANTFGKLGARADHRV
jgi:hypothetical protein